MKKVTKTLNYSNLVIKLASLIEQGCIEAVCSKSEKTIKADICHTPCSELTPSKLLPKKLDKEINYGY